MKTSIVCQALSKLAAMYASKASPDKLDHLFNTSLAAKRAVCRDKTSSPPGNGFGTAHL